MVATLGSSARRSGPTSGERLQAAGLDVLHHQSVVLTIARSSRLASRSCTPGGRPS